MLSNRLEKPFSLIKAFRRGKVSGQSGDRLKHATSGAYLFTLQHFRGCMCTINTQPF